jgi:hypothetical protein
MSYADGWAAINLEMPKRIPRTEYSITSHWKVVKRVTGIDVGVHSSDEVKDRAGIAFMKAWNYDFLWTTLIGPKDFGAWQTDMGHAEYAEGGVDRRDTISCPFKDEEDVLSFDFFEKLGTPNRKELTRRFEEHYQSQCAAYDFGVNMTGVYVTLISGFIGMFGWDLLLLAAGTDPKRFGELTNRYTAWIGEYFAALAAADVPVVMVHDDMVWTSGAIFRPAWYRQYVFPNYKKLFAPLRDSGKKIMFTSDGNYTAFIDDIAATGVHGFVLEPLTDMKYMVEKYGQTHVIIGNAETRVLLSGTKAEIRAEVERCIALGRACPGYFLAVGNHIPSNTPVESCLYYNDVYEELSSR